MAKAKGDVPPIVAAVVAVTNIKKCHKGGRKCDSNNPDDETISSSKRKI